MRCVLVDPYAARNVRRLLRLEPTWELVCVSRTDPPAIIAEAFAGAAAAISQRWDAEIVAYARELRFLQLPNAGTDAVDWFAVPEGCIVANVYEHETTVAEFAISLILESRIGLRRLDSSFRRGEWSMSHRLFGPLHGEIAGSRLGIVGYGRIGRAVAKRARAFEMEVLAVSRNRPVDPDHLAWTGDMSHLDAMLTSLDFLLVACPLTQTTRGLLDAPRLALLPVSAFIVNVARGEIIDEDALFDALAAGRLSGAALDVWWQYPADDGPWPRPSRRPFWEMENVIMTPHVSAWSEGMLSRRWAAIAANLERFSRGEQVANRVSRPGSRD